MRLIYWKQLCMRALVSVQYTHTYKITTGLHAFICVKYIADLTTITLTLATFLEINEKEGSKLSIKEH